MIARLASAALCLCAALAVAQEERPRKERSLTQQQEAERKQRLQHDHEHRHVPRDRPARTQPILSGQPVDRVVARHCSAAPHCLSADGLRNVCRRAEIHYSGRHEGSTDIVGRCQALNSPDPCGADMPNPAAQRAAYGGGCFAQCARVASCIDR